MNTIKKDVLDYDINSDGDIVYSNGNYLIKLSCDGQEEIIKRIELARIIKAF